MKTGMKIDVECRVWEAQKKKNVLYSIRFNFNAIYHETSSHSSIPERTLFCYLITTTLQKSGSAFNLQQLHCKFSLPESDLCSNCSILCVSYQNLLENTSFKMFVFKRNKISQEAFETLYFKAL